MANATVRVDHGLHTLADVVQVDMAGYELREAVRDCDQRLLEIIVGEPDSGTVQRFTGMVPATGNETVQVTF